MLFVLVALVALRLPHQAFDEMGTINLGLQFLLFLVCFYIVKNSNYQNKPVFVNFAVFFFFSILSFGSIFLGTAFLRSSPYPVIYYHEYVNKLGLMFVFSASLIYLFCDYVFQSFKVYQKYMVSLSLSLLLVGFLYHPYVLDPLQLYRTEEYTKFLELKNAHNLLFKDLDREPTDGELMQILDKTNFTQRGSTQLQISVSDVQRLRIYLRPGTEAVLFWKPLNFISMYIDGFLILLMVIFIIQKYETDRAHGAYLEKIGILFVLFCSLDLLHLWALVKSPSIEVYYSLFKIGQYLIIFTLLLMVYVFSMRLRFVLSASGKFYEEELLLHPERITRWRDEIDTLVLNYFFTSKKFFGRLLVLKNSRDPRY